MLTWYDTDNICMYYIIYKGIHWLQHLATPHEVRTGKQVGSTTLVSENGPLGLLDPDSSKTDREQHHLPGLEVETCWNPEIP